MKPKSFGALRAEIAELSAKSRADRCAQRAHDPRSEAFAHLHWYRVTRRPQVRTRLLALAYLRGRSYRAVEYKSAALDLWTLQTVTRLVNQHGGAPVALETLQAWTKIPPTPAQEARYEAARQAWLARRAEATALRIPAEV